MFYKGGVPSQNFKNIFTNIARARAFLSDKLPRKMLVQINLKTLKFADPKFIASIPPRRASGRCPLFRRSQKWTRRLYLYLPRGRKQPPDKIGLMPMGIPAMHSGCLHEDPPPTFPSSFPSSSIMVLQNGQDLEA